MSAWDEEEEEDAVPGENEEQDHFRVNWLAVFAVVIGLIIIGVLLGKLTQAPDSGGLQCPTLESVQAVQSGDHVIVFCQD